MYHTDIPVSLTLIEDSDPFTCALYKFMLNHAQDSYLLSIWRLLLTLLVNVVSLNQLKVLSLPVSPASFEYLSKRLRWFTIYSFLSCEHENQISGCNDLFRLRYFMVRKWDYFIFLNLIFSTLVESTCFLLPPITANNIIDLCTYDFHYRLSGNNEIIKG